MLMSTCDPLNLLGDLVTRIVRIDCRDNHAALRHLGNDALEQGRLPWARRRSEHKITIFLWPLSIELMITESVDRTFGDDENRVPRRGRALPERLGSSC